MGFILSCLFLMVVFMFATYYSRDFHPAKKEKYDPDLLRDIKDIFSLVVATSWDKAAGMSPYHSLKCIDEIIVSESNKHIYLQYLGFSLNYHKNKKRFVVLLTPSIPDNLYYQIKRTLTNNFKYVDIKDGMFVKSFCFSEKTTSNRYYENDFMMTDCIAS